MADMELHQAVEAHFGKEVVSGKGGYWVKGVGFISTAKARQLTGLKGKPRERRERVQAWGDYATVVMLNQQRRRPRITPKAPKLR